MPKNAHLFSAIVAAAGLGAGLAAHSQIAASDGADLLATIAQCAACHGKVGYSVAPDVPNLAGQNVEYLINQLTRLAERPRTDFVEGPATTNPKATDRSRQRKSDVMAQHTSGVPAAILRDVATYYSHLPCVQATRSPDVAPASTGIQWCADCHDPQKAAKIPSIPQIYGQNAAYLENQLRAFKESALRRDETASAARSHPSMDLFARDVPSERLTGIARYYAGLNCAAN